MKGETVLAQAQNAFRQMPLGVFGNTGACMTTIAVLHGTFTWTQLVPLAIAMAILQTMPIRMLWGRTKHYADATWAPRILRRVMIDSVLLGAYWGTAMLVYLPHTDFESTRFLLACACLLCAGAAGVLQAMPRAFAAYAGPMVVASLYLAFRERGVDGGVLAVVIAMMQIAVIWMLWVNHSNFLELLSRNRTLDVLRREAENARLAEAAFVENLNHEIRNAVSGVVGYFDIALESKLSEQEQQVLMSNARDASGMLLTLLSDLLDVGRLNAGRVPLSVAPFDFREAVRLSIVSTSAAIRRRQISVVSAIDDSVPVKLMGDAGRMRQIIVNLVSNAIKVMTKGTVAVQASYGYVEDRGWLRIAVIDDGPGIRADLQKVMFERFSRLADAGNSGAMPGSTGWGLGLSISASLINLMGGRIHVESELGHGATFRIEVPMARAEVLGVPSDPEPTHTLTIRKDFSVLVVDDMPMNRLVLGKMLESLGCRVTHAENGLQALHSVASHPFDLVLMDVDMAEMDGMEATRRIRAMPYGNSEVPIVAVTGFASPEQVARIMASGMNDHALKPIRKTTAAQLLARWVPQTVTFDDSSALP